jgi:hypothetical protein
MAKDKKNAEQTTQAKGAAPGTCSACGGSLADLEDYSFHQRLRRAAACVPAGIAICICWTVLYAFIRLAVGGGLGAAGAAGLALLLVHKIVVGVVLGAVLGILAGIWRTDVGMFLGVVAGSIGGFFVAHAPSLPLLSDAAHRPDIVAAAVIGGILSGITVILAHNWASGKFQKFIGPEPHKPQ